MSRNQPFQAVLSVFVAAALTVPVAASSASAQDTVPLRLRAWAVNINNAARTSNSLGWDIQFARETRMEDGTRKIVVATDRPMSMWELRNSPRSRDYEFSLAEIRLPAEGKGQGKAITRAMLSFNKDTNTLEIENYDREPLRLNQITIVK